ncbi:HlyC/CorC family transporter [Coxiella burnetii]|uniref:Magnesium and cobalt efflux protein CorC n=1 Tax=Coxiella burnetii (strain RSA 493 / Nine Mile phase I) TaxID=227377 RepID=Q83DX7_COXBU|nr:transporter associated domain-containing protein [Coxiella burnetii]NP_819595.2 magnesium and cobalt efflux protein [Coxiella burnetii RSA 493]AAO90109.2 magnesium and cobalt efflux protein [Coxiella burnetii RSA 493]ARI65438.1 magnesium/cobalt efflux protein [Coxiella burnetii]AZV76110.1 CBS domain-containing protein [Coxiella burnetii]MCF2093146.1 CBS domain-containing protein [Coxiella burnetii]MCF2095318.1 CBS domain-containing protein [Coxiella burnetii]
MRETMNEDPHPHRSWLERLSHALLWEPKDREQLIELLHDAKERNLLDQDALAMIEGVLRVSEKKVRDVMIPRAQMVVVDHDATPQSTLPIIIESAHSRFPIISESRDEVIGILLAKDLLQYTVGEKQAKAQIKDLARPAIFIPESKRLDVLLNEFRLKRYHMAIVVDEYGSVSGLITIEDVLEQIVGSIQDETDIVEEEPITKLNPKEFTVKALTPIDVFNNYFGTKINDEDFDTIGGYVMQQIGHLPKRGESIVIDSMKITVMLATKRSIQLLHLTKKTENE